MADNQISIGAAILKIVRWILIAGAALLALGALGVGGFFAYRYSAHDLPASRIVVTVRADRAVCSDPKFPIFVGFVNNSGRTVKLASFRLHAFVPGHSTDYSDYTLYQDDKIIEPGAGVAHCWAARLRSNVPFAADPSADTDSVTDVWDLEWKADDVSFEFEE